MVSSKRIDLIESHNIFSDSWMLYYSEFERKEGEAQDKYYVFFDL